MKLPVVVISSHVARGSVGNRAAVFALETLGHRVWAVPSIVLPFHPGHGRATSIVASAKDFGSLLEDLLDTQWISEIGAILTGYLPTADHVLETAGFISGIKEKVPGAIIACDPVMGDEGKLYLPRSTAETIRNELVPLADLLTPNCFELSWLSGLEADSKTTAAMAAQALATPEVLVTSVPGTTDNRIGNLLCKTGESGRYDAFFADHPKLPHVPNGPGDLTGAIYLADRLSGNEPEWALQHTTSAVFEIVSAASERQTDELDLQADAVSIVHPKTRIDAERLSLPREHHTPVAE